jgi:hypothetical protein
MLFNGIWMCGACRAAGEPTPKAFARKRRWQWCRFSKRRLATGAVPTGSPRTWLGGNGNSRGEYGPLLSAVQLLRSIASRGQRIRQGSMSICRTMSQSCVSTTYHPTSEIRVSDQTASDGMSVSGLASSRVGEGPRPRMFVAPNLITSPCRRVSSSRLSRRSSGWPKLCVRSALLPIGICFYANANEHRAAWAICPCIAEGALASLSDLGVAKLMPTVICRLAIDRSLYASDSTEMPGEPKPPVSTGIESVSLAERGERAA